MARRFGRQQKRALKEANARLRACWLSSEEDNRRLQSEKIELQEELKAGNEQWRYADTIFEHIAELLGEDSAYLPPRLRKKQAVTDDVMQSGSFRVNTYGPGEWPVPSKNRGSRLVMMLSTLNMPILRAHVEMLKRRIVINLVCGYEKRAAIAYSLDAIASRPLDMFTREILTSLAAQLHRDLQRELSETI